MMYAEQISKVKSLQRFYKIHTGWICLLFTVIDNENLSGTVVCKPAFQAFEQGLEIKG